jgi:hypothetical protein
MTERARAERERAARNESLLREVNERVNEFSRTSSFVPFLCECADLECRERIPLTKDEYEAVRAGPAYFAVKPGHVLPELERVVEEGGRFTIVEKVGAGAAVASDLDPRSRQLA